MPKKIKNKKKERKEKKIIFDNFYKMTDFTKFPQKIFMLVRMFDIIF